LAANIVSSEAYFEIVKSTFKAHGNPATAEGQIAYMRSQFDYYGLKSQEWLALARNIMSRHGVYEGEQLKDFVRICFSDEHRELHYFALEMLQRQVKRQPPEFIGFLEELVCTKSWWDSVDWINKLVGIHFRLYPDLIIPWTEKWVTSGNIWLQRICLIFQLTYREQTDFGLMKAYILRLAHSKEFFIQKGAGWALRQYSKYNANSVLEFVINNQQLAPLTKREALKWLNKQQ
jgi:3-methyladenine DNA glycosylase AlkD